MLLGEGGHWAAVTLHFRVLLTACSLSLEDVSVAKGIKLHLFHPLSLSCSDGPGRGQHPGSHVGPLVTAAWADVTDASLMAIIAPSHFTQLFPQPQISREWLFNRQSIVFYNVVTNACMELWGPLCCTLGELVLLLLNSQAVQGYSCGCCSSSSLVSVRVCAPRDFLRGPRSQRSWDGVQSSQKGEALALPSSSLVFPAAQTSPDLGLPILLGDPKFSSLRCRRRMCCSSPEILGSDAGAASPLAPHAQLGQDHPGKHPKSLAEM